MFTERFAAFVLTFLLAVASFAIFEAVLSFQASHCIADNQQATPKKSSPAEHDAEHGHGKHEAASEPFVCTIAGLGTAIRVFMNKNEGFVVGLFTLLLAIVTAWLVWATQNLSRAALDAERPWVGPTENRLAQLAVGAPIQSVIVLKNIGRRPALGMRVAHEGVILNAGLRPNAPVDWDGVPKALFPNANDYYRPFRKHGNLSHADGVGIETGTRVPWITARIEYLDGRGDRHHTNICWRFDGNRGEFVPDGDNDTN